MSGPSTLPTSQAPSALEYGGDEISALVLDPGQCWTRAGFAGEDTPKTVIPSHYGYVNGGDEGKKYYFGDNDVHALRPGMEIANPMADGIVADWDVAPQLWKYALTSRLTTELSEHPLLITEPVWNTPKNREKTAEIAFEDFDVPAFYLAKSAVCAGFASGKPTALVIDIGASNISVTPIHDGIVLKKGSVRTPLGGDFISNQIRSHFAANGIPLSAHYQVQSKMPVEVGKPAEATLRQFKSGEEPTESWKAFQEERVLTEFKECTAQVWAGPGPVPAQGTEGIGGRTFEFPDGYNLVFGAERFRITEGIFAPRQMLIHGEIPHPDPETTQGFGGMVFSAVRDVDIEIKPHILNNTVVTGSGSLLYGLNDRINNEMANVFPGPRVRLTASGNSTERSYASWLGGSILASLGSFHQLWVSKKEYEEHGPGIVEKRCK
ncbi:actin family [Pyronema domesticum]|uniref:Similar to Actin-related protein 4 acc. no. Q5AW89 n=1 Tax=Pyronema omphalodes (strain CBS 100304) TaxID=1076935 RepID=U4LWR0_PYROM|nr:actin family [Pyronema domesticum]CCX34003.1 Similar to Actin-related protein 4; acc. no. Q5AW89 [Pyronema omphalodes CBS 100304]